MDSANLSFVSCLIHYISLQTENKDWIKWFYKESCSYRLSTPAFVVAFKKGWEAQFYWEKCTKNIFIVFIENARI